MEVKRALAGVGLVLERNETTHHVRVKQLMPGGAAEVNGLIRVGDRYVDTCLCTWCASVFGCAILSVGS